MDLNVNKEFFTIAIGITSIVVVVVIASILYEIALPLQLSNSYTSVIGLFIVLLIGISFMFISDIKDNKTNKKKMVKLDNKFLVYLFILIVLTVMNFYT